MDLVIIESPYAGTSKDELEYEWQVYEHVIYARYAMRDSMLNYGESPIASHLLYTQKGLLDDKLPVERKLGIECGLFWREVATSSAFYLDYGMSPGMTAAKNTAEEKGKAFNDRLLPKEILCKIKEEVFHHKCKHYRPLWI